MYPRLSFPNHEHPTFLHFSYVLQTKLPKILLPLGSRQWITFHRVLLFLKVCLKNPQNLTSIFFKSVQKKYCHSNISSYFQILIKNVFWVISHSIKKTQTYTINKEAWVSQHSGMTLDSQKLCANRLHVNVSMQTIFMLQKRKQNRSTNYHLHGFLRIQENRKDWNSYKQKERFLRKSQGFSGSKVGTRTWLKVLHAENV